MSYVVEDGSGRNDANSYVAVADADAYHVLYNNTEWAGLTNTVKQAALLYASQYIDANFTFDGYISREEQTMAWPRLDAFDSESRRLTGVPLKLKNAVCELALVHATTEAVNATFDRGGAVKQETVGPVSVTYMDGAGAGVTYPFLEDILGTICVSGSNGITKIVRS